MKRFVLYTADSRHEEVQIEVRHVNDPIQCPTCETMRRPTPEEIKRSGEEFTKFLHFYLTGHYSEIFRNYYTKGFSR